MRFAVISVSDTRTEADDTGGALIKTYLAEDGHQLVAYKVITDDPEKIEEQLLRLLQMDALDVIIFTGGTGIASRDHTPDVVGKHLSKQLPGFGEIFRVLSFQEIGAAAMLSRARAGISGRKAVFCLPGSPAGVRLALEKLILPEIRHLVSELRR